MNCIKKKYESFCFQWKRESFRKGFSTLIGAIIINFVNGAIYSLCTLAVYQISYIKAKGGSIEIEHLTFYYPIELVFQCVSSFGSGIIYKKLGLHATNLIGITILIIGDYIMYLSNHLAIDLISMILGGIGTGIILYPSTTNAYEWFPLNNGIIVGIMETMISFGSFFWTFFGEKLINSDEIPSEEDTNLYSMDIAIRMKLYLIIQIIVFLVAFILSFILMYERKNYNTEIQIDIKSQDGDLFSKATNIDSSSDLGENFLKDDENINYDENIIDSGITLSNKKYTKNSNSKYNEEKIDFDTSNEYNNNINEINNDEDNDSIAKKLSQEREKYKNEKENKDKNKKRRKSKEENNEGFKGFFNEDLNLRFEGDEFVLTDEDEEEKEVSLKFLLKFTLKSKRLILFIVIVILQAPVSNMAFALYREIGEYYKIETRYLQLVGSLYFIFECLSSFVFGVLCDYCSLKYLLLFINIVGTVVGFTYCLTFKNGLIFFLVQNFLSFSAGGYYPVKDCYLMKVFGKAIYIELSAFVSFLVSLAINLITPITFLVLSGLEDKKLAYWILFVSFGAINFVGTILNFWLSETPVDKSELIMEEEKEEKEKKEEKEDKENKEEKEGKEDL